LTLTDFEDEIEFDNSFFLKLERSFFKTEAAAVFAYSHKSQRKGIVCSVSRNELRWTKKEAKREEDGYFRGKLD
jgi:hypothetical protein